MGITFMARGTAQIAEPIAGDVDFQQELTRIFH
jgi:hypothetical protein